MKKEFYDKPLYSITNYIIDFVLSSIYTAVCNILLIFFVILTAMAPDKFNLLLCFICLIPLGPSLGALYSTTGKLIREKDIDFTHYFWKTYKNNFVSNIKLWFIELILLTVLLIDFQYFYLNYPGNGIYIIFITLMAISSLIYLYALSLNSRFELKLKDLLILSLYIMIKKLPVTILKVFIFAVCYYLLKYISIIFLIFIPTVICIIFYFYDRPIFTQLQKKFSSSN